MLLACHVLNGLEKLQNLWAPQGLVGQLRPEPVSTWSGEIRLPLASTPAAKAVILVIWVIDTETFGCVAHCVHARLHENDIMFIADL